MKQQVLGFKDPIDSFRNSILQWLAAITHADCNIMLSENLDILWRAVLKALVRMVDKLGQRLVPFQGAGNGLQGITGQRPDSAPSTPELLGTVFFSDGDL